MILFQRRVLKMREIKCRAWDEKHKKMWFTGQEGESVGEYTFQTYFDPNDGSLKALIYGNDFLVTDDPYPMYDREEIHLPLMQYTGLKDKNGKEIYKGDVVDIHYPDNVDSRRDTIDRIILNNKQKFIEFLYRTMVDSSIQFLEVIGNIYENPELLKED
jgi:uncharacterized phage protein (TIGR01671 family)